TSVGFESAERGGLSPDGEAGETGEPDIAPTEPEGFRKVTAQSCHRGGHFVSANASELSRGSQSDTAWSAVEEGDAEVLFEGVHVLGQCWLGPAEFAGGGADAAGFGDCAEDEEVFGIT